MLLAALTLFGLTLRESSIESDVTLGNMITSGALVALAFKEL